MFSVHTVWEVCQKRNKHLCLTKPRSGKSRDYRNQRDWLRSLLNIKEANKHGLRFTLEGP